MSLYNATTRTNLAPNPRATATPGWGTYFPSGAGNLSEQGAANTAFPGAPSTLVRATWTTAATAIGGGVLLDGKSSGLPFAITGGNSYTVSLYVRCSKAQTLQLTVNYWNASGTLINSVPGTATAVAGSAWTRLSYAGALAGLGATCMTAVVQSATGGSNWAVGDYLDATAALVELGGTVGTYFDGDTPDVNPGSAGGQVYSWTGTAEASASTYVLQAYSATITPTVDTTSTPPRVVLNLTDADSTETSDTIIRNNPDGTTSVVRTSDGAPLPISGGAALAYDYEAPMGAAVSYFAMNSPGNVSAQVTVPGEAVWLIHPGVPDLSMTVSLAPDTWAKRTYTAARGVFSVMGRKNVVVITDGARKGENSQLVLNIRTAGEKAALDALLADTQVLLLNVPATLGYNNATKYISVADVEYDEPTNKVYESWLIATLPYDETDEPAGGTQAARSYTDVLASETSYQSLYTDYRSYLDLLAGTTSPGWTSVIHIA